MREDDEYGDSKATSMKVLIIGGGIAGLAAAIQLADADYEVTLIEKRPMLGGRASSFIDPETGELVDNCQHVLMRCCKNLLEFYHKLGVEQDIKWYDRFSFVGKDNQISDIYSSSLPAPFHLFPAFLKFKELSLSDKLGIIRAFYYMHSFDDDLIPELDDITIGQWLRDNHQTQQAIDFFWSPTLVSALNEDIETASAKYAFKLFRVGFLRDSHAYEMGIPGIRLSELYSQPAINYLEKKGGTVHLKKAVKEVLVEQNRVTGVTLVDGTILHSDFYISAVPPDMLLNMLPAPVVQSHLYFMNLSNISVSPITGVHFWFDREITTREHLAIPGRTIQWMFNKTKNFQQEGNENSKLYYYGFVISASKTLMSLSRDEITRKALEEVHEVFPLSIEAKLVKSLVIKEPKATLSPTPGCDKFRPESKSPLSNFFLSGDWTQTGWPGTMESAVISGNQCADLIKSKNILD